MVGLGCVDLEELRAHVGDCHRCPLGSTRTQVVFGVGDPRARVMFIGEGPGKNEDLKGEPFVGAAGQLLNELLAHAGLKRSEVYIANVVKCRPPGNRDPEAVEIETCTPFLREQIRIIEPDVLVTLGNFATKFVLKTETGITRLHGTVRQAGRFKVLPIFHPAAAIYDRTKRDDLFRDFERLGRLLAEMDAGTSASATGAGEGGESAESVGGESVGGESAESVGGESVGGGSATGGSAVGEPIGDAHLQAADAGTCEPGEQQRLF